MADILIRGVQFPTMAQAYKTLIVSYDGKVYEGVYPQPTAKKKEPIAHAVELPEHGDLTDRDAIVAHYRECERNLGSDVHLELLTVHDWIEEGIVYDLLNAPVIVPSNKEETK